MRRKILTYSNKVVIKEKSISKYFSKSESFQNEYLANQYVAPLGISPRMIGFDDVSLKVEYEKINGIELSKMKSFKNIPFVKVKALSSYIIFIKHSFNLSLFRSFRLYNIT